jgi:hypothetical protein
MKKRSVVLLAVLLALSLTLASTASAKEVSGTGTIWARGVGQAVLHGDGEISIRCHGLCSVWVKNAEALEAWGRGHRADLPGGGTRFWGWKGTIRAAGEDMTVSMRGGLIEFTATGTGKVFLKGHGKYDLNHHQGFWGPAGETLILEPVEESA